MLRPLMRRVVASGRPLAENNPDNFNCVYDQPECGKADEFLRTIRSAVWVDLPAAVTSYPLTQEMVDRLAGAGMPGVLQTALNADPSQWLGTRLWDDTAALYLLDRDCSTLLARISNRPSTSKPCQQMGESDQRYPCALACRRRDAASPKPILQSLRLRFSQRRDW